MSRSLLKTPAQFDEALITSLIRFGEYDCIARVFLKNKGRISVFFKGAFRLHKKKPFNIQAPSFASIGFIEGQKEGMPNLASCDLDPSLFHLSTSLKAFGMFFYLSEIIEAFLPLEEPAQEIFLLAKKAYEKIIKSGPHSQIVRAFELKLLLYAGFLPSLDFDQEVFAFDPTNCVFLSKPNSDSIPFSTKALDLARTLTKTPIDEIFCQDMDLLKCVGRLFFARLKLLRKEKLKSITFLRQIGYQ